MKTYFAQELQQKLYQQYKCHKNTAFLFFFSPTIDDVLNLKTRLMDKLTDIS